MRIFKLTRWSSLEKTLDQRPNVFLSQFIIIGALACFIQLITDFFSTAYLASFFDFIILGLLYLAFHLNENRKHLIAKFLFVGLGSFIIFSYSAIVPKEVGVYFIFFPLLTITFLIFSNNEQYYKYIAIAYIAILFITLEITNYQPYGKVEIYTGESTEPSYYLNLLLSIAAIIFSMYNIDVINHEITKQRKQIELELKDRNEELLQINEELDHFVYSASHDLKAPLLSILGLINVARYDTSDQHVLSIFRRIEERVARLNTFIKDVIEISRNSRTEVQWEQVDVFKLVSNVIENNLYKEGSEKILFDCEDLRGKTIMADKIRLEIIINNLISNAIKYIDTEKDEHRVKMSLNISKTRANFKLTDNGIGISEERLKKVFKMFYRGEGNTEGSGLGLYIVKKVVEKLEGKIEMKSVLKKGTEINLSIPIKQKQVPLFGNVHIHSPSST